MEKIKKLQIFLLITGSFSLFGCQVIPASPANVSGDYSLNKNPQNGLLVVAISYEGSLFGTMNYVVANASLASRLNHGLTLFGVGPENYDWRSKVFTNESGFGRLVIAELPPGQYVLASWALDPPKSSAYSRYRFSSTKPLNQRFTVQAGKVVYVGEFHVATISEVGTTKGSYKIGCADQRERDLPLLFERVQSIKREQVIFDTECESESKDNSL